MKNKKAQFVEIDFFLAILILAMGIIVITAPFINIKEDIQADRLSYDAVTILSTMKLQDLEHDMQNEIKKESEKLNVNVTNEDTLTDLITKLIVSADADTNTAKKNKLMNLSKYIANESLKNIIPERYKYEVVIKSGDQTYNLIELEENQKTNLASQSRTLLSGLEVGKPMLGYIASANLKEIKKTETAYEFIGGFIGQGQINFKINVPSNETKDIFLEGLFKDNFEVHINNNYCQTINAGFVKENLPCINLIHENENDITIKFKGNEEQNHYVSGGLIKINYNIIQMPTTQTEKTITKRKNIPEIDGVINIYDSFYVPGKLKHLKIVLNHEINIVYDENDDEENEAELMLIIENQTIYTNNKSGKTNKTINIDWTNSIESSTIPYRLGFPDLTAVIETKKPVDIVYVTDLSGSMWYHPDRSVYKNGNINDLINLAGFNKEKICGWDGSEQFIYNYNNNEYVQRIYLSVCLTNYFINELLDDDADVRIGIAGYGSDVFYENNKYDIINLTYNENELIDFSNDMINKNRGDTCISCGLAAGINLLMQDDLTERKKIIILMTDGEANAYYGGGTKGYSNGQLPPAQPVLRKYDNVGFGESQSRQDAEYYANYAKNNNMTNITIYSLSFAAPSSLTTFLKKISSNNQEDLNYYFEGQDAESLALAFNSIIEGITTAEFVAQLINVSREDYDIFETKISNSYIDYTYEPIQDSSTVGKIKVTNEYKFNENCEQNINFNTTRAIGGGYVTSYSDNIWTVATEINNKKIFDVLKYNKPLGRLGDPFMIGIPLGILKSQNKILLTLKSDEDEDITLCNKENKLIYDLYFPATFTINQIKEKSEGCNWKVNTQTIKIPSSYTGDNECTLNGEINSNDVMQLLGYEIINTLTHEEKLVIDLKNSKLDVTVAQIDNIPYMWGPAIIGVSVWR